MNETEKILKDFRQFLIDNGVLSLYIIKISHEFSRRNFYYKINIRDIIGGIFPWDVSADWKLMSNKWVSYINDNCTSTVSIRSDELLHYLTNNKTTRLLKFAKTL